MERLSAEEVGLTSVTHFSTAECVAAADISIDFLQRNGVIRLLPQRIRRLIIALNVTTFRGREKSEEARIEMVDRIKKAVQPWCG